MMLNAIHHYLLEEIYARLARLMVWSNQVLE